MAFYFARIWLTDSAAKLVLIAAVLVAKISAANIACALLPKGKPALVEAGGVRSVSAGRGSGVPHGAYGAAADIVYAVSAVFVCHYTCGSQRK